MMEILLVTAEFPPLIGGIATYSYNMAKAVRMAGYDLKVLTSVGLESKCEGFDLGTIIRTPNFLNKKGLKVIPLLLFTLWFCIKDRPEVLLLMKWTHEGIVGYIVKRLFGINYILVAHGSEILQHKNRRSFQWAMKLFFNGAEKIIVNSTFTKQLVINLGIKSDKVVVVYPALDVQNYNQDIDTQDVEEKYALKDKRVILTVGRLVERKGHTQVIKVLSELREQYPDLIYVIVGEGQYRSELERLVELCNVGHRVRIIGFVSEIELLKLYKLCEVYVTPSRETRGDVEGFGIALLEAALFSKPVIAGDSGGVRDAVVDGETGFLVNPSDLEDIKEKLVLLLDNDDLRKKLGKNGHDRVIREFSLIRQVQQIKEIFSLATDNNGFF